MSDDDRHAAVAACLDVLLRMIPEYCTEAGAECCTDAEHNDAIALAAKVVYGPRSKWPQGVRAAADGKYA